MKTCTKCSVAKSDKAFPSDGRTKDNLSAVCADCRFGGKQMSETETRVAIRDFGFDQAVSADQLPAIVKRIREQADADTDTLETVTLERVPILAEGGPYYGTGSPPEGDYYTKADLEEIAAANRELAAEVKPANKIGHSKEQKLLANSGFAIKDDEMPAAGWLSGESFTVEEADDGKWKLYANITDVPAKLAKLFVAKAFRTRSVELSKVTAQGDGEETVYDAVVTGLAWLGAKAPAVRTLDDIYALYHDGAKDSSRRVVQLLYADANDVPTEVIRTIEYADDASTAQIVWEPEDGFQDLSSDLSAALNPSGGDRRYWVQDVSVKLDKCIVNDWQSNATWIVPFTMRADGDPVPSPASDWILAEQAWVEAADELAERNFGDTLKFSRAAADTSSEMPTITKLTDLNDEQIVTLAKTFGIEGEDATALRPKLEEHMKLFAAEQPEGDEGNGGAGDGAGDGGQGGDAPAPDGASTESAREMAELRHKASLGERAYEERRIEKREALITFGLRDSEGQSRILPAQADQWREFYNANPELAEAQMKALPVRDTRTFGSDETGLPDGQTVETAAEVGDQAWAEYAAATGIHIEEAAA